MWAARQAASLLAARQAARKRASGRLHRRLEPAEAEPGCSANSAPAEGNHDLKVGDVARSYGLRKPQGYAAQAQKPWRVVLALHPNGSMSDYWDGTSGIRALRRC